MADKVFIVSEDALAQELIPLYECYKMPVSELEKLSKKVITPKEAVELLASRGLNLDLYHPIYRESKEEKEIPISKTYTIIVTNEDEETSTDDIIHEIEITEDVLNVELLEEWNNKLKVQVTTEVTFKYENLELLIDKEFGQECEFMDMEFNF